MILYVSIRSKLPASWMVRMAPSICCAAFNHNGTWECMLIKCHLPNMAIYHHIHIPSYIYRIVYRIISIYPSLSISISHGWQSLNLQRPEIHRCSWRAAAPWMRWPLPMEWPSTSAAAQGHGAIWPQGIWWMNGKSRRKHGDICIYIDRDR